MSGLDGLDFYGTMRMERSRLHINAYLPRVKNPRSKARIARLRKRPALQLGLLADSKRVGDAVEWYDDTMGVCLCAAFTDWFVYFPGCSKSVYD